MSLVSDADKIILDKINQLSSKQRQSLRDFLDFLLSKNPDSISENVSSQEEEKQVSFYEATKEIAGAIDGLPSDLSTNKKYLENLGK